MASAAKVATSTSAKAGAIGTTPSAAETVAPGARGGAGSSGASGGGGKRGGGRGGRGGKGRGGGGAGGGGGGGGYAQSQNQSYKQEQGHGQGQRQGRNKGKGKTQPHVQGQQKPDPDAGTATLPVEGTEKLAGADEAADSEDVCWICAEPVTYYSVSACNHRTCHVCALRLRALYKKTECTFCKEPQQYVVFTTSPERAYGEYDLGGIPHRDGKLSIYFETQEMMEETLILLRFNCPDPDCDYIGNGWGDLKLHTRAVHNRLMCDLCLRNKKVFAHEHALYPPNVLPVHLPSMYQRHRFNVSRDQVEGGVHPFCEFCHECFFGDDELFTHCREKHEECFICKRNDIRHQYFHDYNSLERHFNEEHYPCTQPQCLARKFVVFGSMMDLKVHIVEEHGGDMTYRDRKDARRVVADFAFEDAGGRYGHGRRDHHEREREREPPPSRPPSSQMTIFAGPSRQQPTAQNRRQAFESAASASQVAIEANRVPSPTKDDVDPIVTERHSALIARLQSLAANPTTAVPAVKAAMRGYRSSESSARDLISTVWNILDRNLENTASIINAFVDFLEEEEKKQDLLASWNSFAIEQRRQFPELAPTAVGGNYAAIATGRVLNAKRSTKARSSQKSSRTVWDRVTQAASSSSTPSSAAPSSSSHFPALERFPPLQSSSRSSSSGPAIRPPPPPSQRTTPWTSSSAVAAAGSAPPRPVESKIQVTPAPSRSNSSSSKQSQRPPKLSAAQFPELPTSSGVKLKAPVSGNPSLRNILGTSSAPAVAAWRAGPAGSVNTADDEAGTGVGDVVAEQGGVGGQGKGKKSKGKQKQTLFTLGSFPS